MNKRRSLGRGLDALLSSARPMPPPPPTTGAGSEPVAAPAAAPAPAPSGEGLREVPVDLLRRGKYQPRVDMREDSLTELAESIKAQGVVQPIVVRPLPNPAGGETQYEIVAGERRWRAAQIAGLATIPAVVRDIPDESAVAVALIENIQRENLNPLRLLELPRPVREMVERRQLDMGHARALLGLESPELTIEIAEQARKHQWSVRATEDAVRRHSAPQAGSKAGKEAPRGASDPNVRRLETDLSEKLGATVAIEHGPKGGRVVIRYNGLEELEGILAHIK